MLGIVLVTHGNLAQEFIRISEHIVGRQEQIVPVCIELEDNIERCRESILQAVDSVDTGDGVVVLTDMFGGTPSNLSISVMGERNVEVVAGVNLPMMIKLLSIRANLTMTDAVLHTQESGRKYINIASNLLKRHA